MRWSALVAAAVVVAGWAPAAWGQATSVQLPTFNVFTVNTTVSVPDSGGAYLGGIGRRATGASRSGPPFARALPGLGGDVQAAGAWASASIIDLDELDRFILGQASTDAAQPASPGDDLGREVAAAQQDAPPQSVAAVRRQQDAKAAAREQEGLAQLARASQAEGEGKLGAARVYYRMAASRLTGDLKQQALTRLALLASDKPPPQIADGRANP